MEQENMSVQDELGAEDLLPEELTEEPEDNSESLDTVFNEPEQGAEGDQQPDTGTGQKEPGYVKSRIEKAVQKVRDEMTAQFEAQMAPYREYMINAEAQELVNSGKVKDLETARELVRYRKGQPQTVQAESNTPPRNSQGQFTRREESGSDPATMARIDMLKHQANRIKAGNGPDVIAEFQTNEEIKQKVISGEMDFYDVAEMMKESPRRRTPPPMRSPNGASGSQKTAIDNMSDEQFARLEKRIAEGGRFSLR